MLLQRQHSRQMDQGIDADIVLDMELFAHMLKSGQVVSQKLFIYVHVARLAT